MKNELWLSPISIWEATLLIEAKRLRIKGDPRAWLQRVVVEVPLNEAPLTHEVAFESHRVGVSHEDPADRFLAATAKVYELVLVTADERLSAGRGFKTLAN